MKPQKLADVVLPVACWAETRHYAHYNARTMTGRCTSLGHEYPQAITQIHSNDATRLGVRDGDRIKISSRRGEVISTTRTGDIVPEGAIFMDFHFPEANSNVLLGTSLDPITKTQDYKVCVVRVEAASGDKPYLIRPGKARPGRLQLFYGHRVFFPAPGQLPPYSFLRP